MLQVILGVMRCISDFQKPCASKTSGFRVKDTSRSLCYPVLCGHCLPSCLAERQAPGLLVLIQGDDDAWSLVGITINGVCQL